MRIDVIASEDHYLSHMMPIWNALPEWLRGDVHSLCAPGAAVRPPLGRVAMVAGWQDVAPLRGQCPMIYVEHGVGQTYSDRIMHPSYSGGGDRHRGVIGYIAPSQTVADRWPKPAVAVGCPKLDAWQEHKTPCQLDPHRRPVVAFAWHWDCTLAPETRSVWNHYEPLFGLLVERYNDQGFDVAAHAHPKWRGEMDVTMAGYSRLSVYRNEINLFAFADVLIVDNSSLAYEFAALGRPVLLLNAPWYRRQVEHGLRFWSHPPGPQFDGPEELLDFNLWDLFVDTPTRAESRLLSLTATAHAYEAVDGKASQRAADWIVSQLAAV